MANTPAYFMGYTWHLRGIKMRLRDIPRGNSLPIMLYILNFKKLNCSMDTDFQKVEYFHAYKASTKICDNVSRFIHCLILKRISMSKKGDKTSVIKWS